MATKKVYKMTIDQSSSTHQGSIIRCIIPAANKTAVQPGQPPLRMAQAMITIIDPDNTLAAGYKFSQQVTITIE